MAFINARLCNKMLNLLGFIMLFYLQQTYVNGAVNNRSECGEYITGSNGYITTPNFPKAFPLPLSCKWVFYVPPGEKVVLYFTEYYLWKLFNIVEYDYYVDETNNTGRYDVGILRVQQDRVIYLEGLKPYLVFNFLVVDMGKIHLRVADFMLDVYGFNITYEFTDINKTVRTDLCSVFKCSYLGRCMVDNDFKRFKCDCHNGFLGDFCQYGPYCDPERGYNLCKNGGQCRYFWGSSVNTCDCPPGFAGVKCQINQKGRIAAECAELDCMHSCDVNMDGVLGCTCDDGFMLESDNKRCTVVAVDVNSEVRFVETSEVNITDACIDIMTNELYFLMQVDDFSHNFSYLNISNTRNDNTSHYFSIYFMVDKILELEVKVFMERLITVNTTHCNCALDSGYLHFNAQVAIPVKKALHSMTLVNYDKRPPRLGSFLTLVCTVRGPLHVDIFWFKDGAPINAYRSLRNMWETRVPTSKDKHISILDIYSVAPQDAGIFSCTAHDAINEEKRSIKVDIMPSASIIISPVRASVHIGSKLTISCISYDDVKSDFKYQWLKNGKTLYAGIDAEVIENIAPTGSRLKLETVQKDTNYTCMVESDKFGIISNSSLIYVIKGKYYCIGETSYGISWENTTSEMYDVKYCPAGTKGECTRKCMCQHDTCVWDVPNFASCTSVKANFIYNMLVTIQLGYQFYTLDEILFSVENFTSQFNTTNLSFTGDLNLMGLTLWKLQEYKNKFGLSETHSFSLLKVLSVLDSFLNITDSLSGEQERHLKMMPYILKVMDEIRDVSIRQPQHQSSKMTLHNIEYAVDKRLSHNISQPPVHLKLHGITVDVQVPVVKSDFNEITFLALSYNVRNKKYNFTASNDLYLNSMIVKIGVVNDDPLFMQDVFSTFTVKFHHKDIHRPEQHNVPHNQSYCALWKFIKFPQDEWDLEGCTVLEVTAIYTVCECSWSGVYAVVNRQVTVTPKESPSHEKSVNESYLSASVLFVPVLGFLSYLLFFSIFSCRRAKKKYFTPAQINLYVVMVFFGIVLYHGIIEFKFKAICSLNRHATEVLYLAAISSFVIEALMSYMKYGCYKIHQLHVAFHVVSLWAVPIIFSLLIAIEYALHDSSEEENTRLGQEWSCLPNNSDFTFLCSVAIGAFLCVLLFGIQIASVILSYKKSKEHLRFQMFQSIKYLCSVFLFKLLISCIAYRNTVNLLWTTLILIAILMVWAPITIFIVQPEEESIVLPLGNICRIWCRRCININPVKLKMSNSSSVSTFRGSLCVLLSVIAFVRPDTTSTIQSKTDESDEVYQRDLKYTLDHKAHLSSLLGSSSAEDSARFLVQFPLLNSSKISDCEKPLKATCYIQD